MTPAFAATSQASAASLTVVGVGARIAPRLRADLACALQARASASVRKVFLMVFWSRDDQTWAWYVGRQSQSSPTRLAQRRAWRGFIPSGRVRRFGRSAMPTLLAL